MTKNLNTSLLWFWLARFSINIMTQSLMGRLLQITALNLAENMVFQISSAFLVECHCPEKLCKAVQQILSILILL
jgi:uncharacterized protein YybS (DUF2232 family)